MNEIEAKHKELKETWERLTPDYKKGRLDGFNLGVEMARKEFNDLLDEITKAYLYNDACDCGGCLKFRKIKQSLEEKK